MINVGIIGTGGMAHSHARNYKDLEGAALYSCCDIDEQRAKDFAGEFQIPNSTTDVDAMLADPNLHAVSIVTPDPYHAPLSLKAIAASAISWASG